MDKNLKVIKNFDQMEVGDIYNLSDDNKTYVCEINNADSYIDARSGATMKSNSSYKHEISSAYADKLIELGYLAPVTKKTDDVEYKNVFEEMKKLQEGYIEDLKNLDENYKDQPACVKIEAETVLTNMIKLIDHLLSLKK